MTGRFWGAFSLAFIGTALVLSGGAGGTAWMLVPMPPQRFATSAFSFDLAPGWSCHREVTEHVCRRGAPPSNDIIILTMKRRGPDDTLNAYEAHLRGPIPLAGGNGTAQLVSLDRRMIGGTTWVVCRLTGSELPNWDTTYLAGNTAEIGILITFSVHARYREERERDLKAMMESIVVNQRGI